MSAVETLPRTPAERLGLKQTLALRGLDGITLLLLPAILFTLALFVYPFLYGLWLSFRPKAGGLASPTTPPSSAILSSTRRSERRSGWRCP